MSRRALVVGIDNYLHVSCLTGCVADARAVHELLARNQDTSPNYECKMMLASPDDDTTITRGQLRQACQELFASDYSGEVLLYFAGHGALTANGGYLGTSDAEKNDLGIPMQEVMQMACASRASDILLILDCCHSGDMGNAPLLNLGGASTLATLRENMTIIAASRNTQTSAEYGGHGVFTAKLLDALDGAAADHLGWVTGPSIYSCIERQFGAWEQRPVYKSHATNVATIRKCAPLIERAKLVELEQLFPDPHHRLKLDPEYEPEDEHGNLHEPVNYPKVAVAKLLKELRDVGLVKPSKRGEQLFWTARKGHTVELTHRGREYWRLIHFGRI